MIYKYFLNGFIGHKKPYNNFFYFANEEKEFHETCAKIKDWRYKNLEITYIYNSNGHRSKEIHDLDENYLLTIGCSATEGQAMKLEETYTYMLSKNLNMDYYNLALKNSDMATLYYNLTMFINKVKIKPKLIVLQWPDFYRYHLVHKDGQYAVYSPYGYFGYSYDYEVFKTLHMYEVPEATSQFYRKLTLEFLRPHNINTVELNYMPHIRISSDDYNTKIVQWDIQTTNIVDYARDNLHAGVKTNELWTNKILESLGK